MAIFIVTFIAIALGSAIIVGSYVMLSGKSSKSANKEIETILDKVKGVDADIEELLQHQEGYCAQGQYENLSGRVNTIRAELEKEKQGLDELEKGLDEAQKNVENKETHQQDLKTSREEDETKLEELMAQYSDISTESISLEQKLAESMKNLDSLSEDVQLTEDQKNIVDDISEALSRSGESLRNLLMEYEGVNERLKLLREQHDDLEDEYTKLVEQQLGE